MGDTVMREHSGKPFDKSRPDQPEEYFKALDGLRGLMAIGVIVAHVNKTWFPGAEAMMDVFFVISGFLITLLLARSQKKTGTINISLFMKNRLIRLYPLLMVTIAVYLVAVSFTTGLTDAHVTDAIRSLLYYSNFSKLEPQLYPTLFGQTWSLSIEEQFYIVWPLCLILMMKNRTSYRTTLIALILVLGLSVVWKNYLIAQGAPWSRIYFGSDTRIDAFCAGALLAILWHTNSIPKQSRALQLTCKLSALFLIGIIASIDARLVSYFSWQQPLLLALSCMSILCLSLPGTHLLKTFFSQTYISRTGLICYGTYLWHWPLIYILLTTIKPDKLTLLIIVLPTTLIMATLSYKYIERPLLSRRKRAHS